MTKLSKKSIELLSKAHPKLQALMLLTAHNVDYNFTISETLRTAERQIQLKAEGKSKTLNSKHLIQKDGYSHALDCYPLTDDSKKIEWENFKKFIDDVKAAAEQLGYSNVFEFGIDWKFKDSGHIELK